MAFENLIIRARSVTKSYGLESVLSDFNLDVWNGSIVGILGMSGSGKTTALRLIAGFEKPDSGIIEMRSEIISSEDTYLPPEQRNVGMVFQDYALFPHLNVEKNISFGLNAFEMKSGRLEEVISMCNLEEYRKKFPQELSGGRRRHHLRQQLPRLVRDLHRGRRFHRWRDAPGRLHHKGEVSAALRRRRAALLGRAREEGAARLLDGAAAAARRAGRPPPPSRRPPPPRRGWAAQRRRRAERARNSMARLGRQRPRRRRRARPVAFTRRRGPPPASHRHRGQWDTARGSPVSPAKWCEHGPSERKFTCCS